MRGTEQKMVGWQAWKEEGEYRRARQISTPSETGSGSQGWLEWQALRAQGAMGWLADGQAGWLVRDGCKSDPAPQPSELPSHPGNCTAHHAQWYSTTC